MEVDNRKIADCGDGLELVWDCKNGKEIVYFDNGSGKELTEDEIMIETNSYSEAEKVFNNTKAYMV